MIAATRTPFRILALASALVAALSGGTGALAQQAPAGGAVIASEPGRAAAVGTVEASARVVGIDKGTRTLTLKGAKGNAIDLVAGEEVRNFDQIRVGDLVVVRYLQALSLVLRTTKGASGAPVERQETVQAKPGERPAGAGAREVNAIAEVTALDPKAGTMTLKGPRGNSVTLAVRNPEQFKLVKKGDQVEVTYTEAVAVSVEPGKGTK